MKKLKKVRAGARRRRGWWMCVAIGALLAWVPGAASADDERKGVVGLAVMQDAEDPTVYNLADFVPVDIQSVSIARVTNEGAITSLVNGQDCGKSIVNYMLGYENGKVDGKVMQARLRECGVTEPTAADYFAAVYNNYLLVVKLSSETIAELRSGEASDVKMEGKWYLYGLELTPEDMTEMSEFLPSDGDDAATLGKKRYRYEGVSVPMRLIEKGTKIDADLPARLAKHLSYKTSEDLAPKVEKETVSPSTAVKVALSPLVIVK